MMTPAQLLFLLLAVSAGMLTLWFAFELWLLKTGRHPITWYARSWANGHIFAAAVAALIGAFTAGIAATHFWLDSPCQPFGR